MPSQMEAACLAAYRALQAVHSVDIVYSRPSTGHSVNLARVVPGKTPHDVVSDGQLLERVQARDFLIEVSKLQLNNVEVLPLRGDRVTEGTRSYMVLSNGVDAMWKYTDQTRQIIRIHCKEL